MLSIHEINGRCVHEFACSIHGCKVKVHRYLDTKDARSTGNMRKHVRLCWGTEVLDAANNTKYVPISLGVYSGLAP